MNKRIPPEIQTILQKQAEVEVSNIKVRKVSGS